MGVIEDFNRTLKELKDSINPTIKETIERNKPLLIDEQTETQLFDKGEDSEAKPLTPSYALSTRIIKKKKGQPTNRVTLKDTGDLYRSITIDARSTSFEIQAGAAYFGFLVTHYSNNKILGLQDEFLEQFTEQAIVPNIEKKFKQIIS